MEKYIFLTNQEKNSANGIDTYFAISETKIEELKISETYGDYGIKVDSSVAGDYLELISQNAVDFVKSYKEEDNSKIGDIIYAYEESSLFDSILSSLEEGVDFEATYQYCKGFNYHNGRNWKTIILEMPHYYDGHLEWQIVEDKALVKRLRTAITRKKNGKKGFGYTNYSHGSVQIQESYYEGAWESYTLTINE